MEFTGFDYILYSHKDYQEVIKQFNDALLTEGYRCDAADDKSMDDSEKSTEFFYYKNQKMYDLHLRMGYNTRLNGEGCVYLYTGVEPLDSSFVVADTMDVKNEFYQYVWFMGEYRFYALRLPGDINHCRFSKRIFDILANILKS